MYTANTISDIWQYKGFITNAVKREFQARYTGSLFGLAWVIINPLITILIYTVIFSNLMQSRLPGIQDTMAYSIYLCAGLLPWLLFSEIITRSQTIFIENSNLIKKSNFPRMCLPIILITTAFIDFLIIFGLFLIFLILTGRFPGLIIFAMIPVLLIQLVISTGIGILTGTLNVMLRDVSKLMIIILQFWFWLTPIVYPIGMLPKKAIIWLSLNPLVAVFTSYHSIFLTHTLPAWRTLLPGIVLGVVLLLLSGTIFNKFYADMVDEL